MKSCKKIMKQLLVIIKIKWKQIGNQKQMVV